MHKKKGDHIKQRSNDFLENRKRKREDDEEVAEEEEKPRKFKKIKAISCICLGEKNSKMIQCVRCYEWFVFNYCFFHLHF
jgi:hypothetical protein